MQSQLLHPNEIFTVNAAGQNKTYEDQNGSVHTYTFDVLGRTTADAVTTLGSGVDGAVRRLEFSFDTGGRPYQLTSYDAASGGNVVNQVQLDYNGLGQLTKEYQEHGGAVNTGTSLKVQYAYSEMASGANHSRITSMTYPNGTAINYGYGSGLDDSISRLTTLAYSTLNTETLSYLGLGTVVKRVESEPGIELTYVKLSGESNGDAGDQYIGLDRFGRIVDQRWIVTSSGTARDRFQYGYDRDSNRLYRDNLLDNNFDELYHADGSSNGYDSLNQLLEFQRGPLSDTNSDNIPDTVSSQTRRQVWTMDGQGNFSDVSTDGTGQSRTHDKQNRLTVVASNNLAYDSNGNMTTDETGKTLVWDAWDRFVQFKNGETVVDTFKYDAVGRRVSENPGTTRDLYYTAGWQVIEERTSGTARAHNIWSPVYVDAMVFRYRDSDTNGTLDERLYVMQDANFNVTGLVDTSGAAVERSVYDPYGAITYLTGSWGSRSASSYGWVYQHQGSRFVIEVNLYDKRRRWESPPLQRFVSADPIWATNLYMAYGNGPVNWLDPSGARALYRKNYFPQQSEVKITTGSGRTRTLVEPTWSRLYLELLAIENAGDWIQSMTIYGHGNERMTHIQPGEGADLHWMGVMPNLYRDPRVVIGGPDGARDITDLLNRITRRGTTIYLMSCFSSYDSYAADFSRAVPQPHVVGSDYQATTYGWLYIPSNYRGGKTIMRRLSDLEERYNLFPWRRTRPEPTPEPTPAAPTPDPSGDLDPNEDFGFRNYGNPERNGWRFDETTRRWMRMRPIGLGPEGDE